MILQSPSTLSFMVALAALAAGGCGDPSQRALRQAPAVSSPAPAEERPAVSLDDARVERDVASRLNDRLDLSAPWTAMDATVSYLAADDAVARDGGVDVIVHFHGAPLADDEWRTSAVAALVVSVQLPGYGVAPYRDLLAPEGRFGAIVDDAVRAIGGTHARRLGLVSWSAGYGAMQAILGDPVWYATVDTVVLLDGMHADYAEGLPDDASIAVFERLARDAVAGEKQLLVTHSSVTPGGYASTTETAAMLLAFAGVPRVEELRTNARGMAEWCHADEGGLHVRGYRGDTLRDHVDQLHLVGDLVRTFVAPRWTRLARLEEERATAFEL